jgi:hypothetical protein
MKLLSFLLITFISFSSYSATELPQHAEGRDDKGYNYKKHYRKAHRKAFFARIFHTGCYGKQNVH